MVDLALIGASSFLTYYYFVIRRHLADQPAQELSATRTSSIGTHDTIKTTEDQEDQAMMETTTSSTPKEEKYLMSQQNMTSPRAAQLSCFHCRHEEEKEKEL